MAIGVLGIIALVTFQWAIIFKASLQKSYNLIASARETASPPRLLLSVAGKTISATLSANPPSITVGQYSTLTWTSKNARSCVGTNFSTGSLTSGSVTVSPTSTTVYTINCTSPRGSATANTTITVLAPSATPTRTPSPTSIPTPPITSSLHTYPAYGGTTYVSPDYEVTLQQGAAPMMSSFAAVSFQQSSYPMYDENGSLIQTFTPNPKHNAVRHSSTIFSFGDAPVTVRVKVKPGTPHISLPLTSCKVLPSSYGIPCTLANADTMVFTLTRPEKVFVIANYDTVWNKYVALGQGHRPISAWREYATQRQMPDYHDVTKTEITEGFKNPFIVIAHGLEDPSDIPAKAGALVVNPGQMVTQTAIDNASVIWFTPGVHDYSTIGTDPGNQIILKKGQTVYIEGGAYVLARFTRSSAGVGTTSILGRGVVSGLNHKWVKKIRYLAAVLLDIDVVQGITITDRAAYGIERLGGSSASVPMGISDIAMIGAWHGNTDGIEGRNATIEDSLLMALDDNLKMMEQFQARRLVIWQGANAHPIMIHENTNRDLTGSIAEDIDVIAYTRTPPNGTDEWELVSSAAIASVRGGNSTVSNFTFRNIRVESPYLTRVIDVYNLNTNLINPGWFSPTTDTNHSRVNGILFQNITVTSPVIGLESLLGSAYPDSFQNVTMQNLVINGTKVTEANKETFFEFEGDLTGISFLP